MGDIPKPTKEEVERFNEQCNECRYGHWVKGVFKTRKECSLGFEPEVCQHDLDKFEDED